MENNSPRIRTLLRQANRVAEGGKRAAAEQLYRQIIDEAPDTPEAWIGLGDVLNKESAKEEAYNQAIAIDPDNVLAANRLEQLRSVEISRTDLSEDQQGLLTVLEKANPGDNPVASDSSLLQEEKEYILSPASNEPSSSSSSDGRVHNSGDLSIGSQVLYCANHPTRETHLRCNKCGKPICSSCAQPTPVGYRCPECIREHQDIFYTAKPIDYVIAVIVALPLSLIAGILAPRLWFFVIFLGPIIGTFIGRIVFRAVGRRRGRGMPQLVSAIIIAGALVPLIPSLLLLLTGNLNISLMSLLFSGIYMFTASGAAYYQMR
jgi:hypothetical protein